MNKKEILFYEAICITPACCDDDGVNGSGNIFRPPLLM